MLSVTINRDVEQYQESVLFGLSAGQAAAVFSAIAAGLLMVALLYFGFGIPVEAGIYASLPVCIPLLLPAFGKKYGLSVTERIRESNKRKKVLFYQAAPLKKREEPCRKRGVSLWMALLRRKEKKKEGPDGKKKRISADKK